jgi:hypothetical protein
MIHPLHGRKGGKAQLGEVNPLVARIFLPGPGRPVRKGFGADPFDDGLSLWFICWNSPRVDLACIPLMSTKPAI